MYSVKAEAVKRNLRLKLIKNSGRAIMSRGVYKGVYIYGL